MAIDTRDLFKEADPFLLVNSVYWKPATYGAESEMKHLPASEETFKMIL